MTRAGLIGGGVIGGGWAARFLLNGGMSKFLIPIQRPRANGCGSVQCASRAAHAV